MSNPFFSIIAPANRSKFYKRMYDSIGVNNKMPFEVIFVGNDPPDKSIADNFHYIETNVKISQCTEIAARNAVGDFLIQVADDWVLSEGFLNKIYDYILAKGDNTFISFSFAINGVMRDDWLCYRSPDKKIRYCDMGITGAFDRKLWHEMGGVDNRFIYNFHEVDQHFKFRQHKELFITPDCWVDEIRDAHKYQRRASKILGQVEARKLFRKFWMKEEHVMSRIRLEPNMPFLDKDIMTKSQGRTVEGIWD